MGRLVHLGDSKVEDNLAISYLIDLLLNVAVNRGIDFIPCWDEVHSSNMSKVCRNEQEYAETEAFYAEQGIKLMAVQKANTSLQNVQKILYLKAKRYVKARF